MNDSVFIGITALAGIGLVIGIVRIWKSSLKKRLNNVDNMSLSIFLASQVVAFALLFSGAFKEIPLLKSLIVQSADSSMKLIEFTGVFILIIVLVYLAISGLSNMIFKMVNPDSVGIFQEVKDNNVSSLVLLAGVIIALAAICGPLLSEVFLEIIPERDVPRWF